MKRRKKVKENDNGVYYFLEEQIVYIYKQVIGILKKKQKQTQRHKNIIMNLWTITPQQQHQI